MIDIFSSLSGFAIWSCILLASKSAWSRPIQVVAFTALAILAVLQLFVPLEIRVPIALGKPLNLMFRLGALSIIGWYVAGIWRGGAIREHIRNRS